ncbi:MAG: hypothetical protein QOF11_1204 [Chloroflexota bacterium]|nr:hypothetical protein [Chloroflexota bacterium]
MTTIDGPSPALTLGVVAILSYTVVKAGVVYGRGDHMLHHRSRAFHSFPVLGLVGLPDRPVRPVAVDDVARMLVAAGVGDERLANRTIVALGPDELPLGTAVRRVAHVVGRRPVFVRLPIAAQLLLATVAEWTRDLRWCAAQMEVGG